ncbi:uncharacterized protein LOC113464115 [Ceratina calcarata]|uniref:Uncharacterized protein LOC113464115 n=1 Tax=Ceratina calcarata TaxID=156304 RepID=A0AAJ7W9F8_9HYME|nr:uncharacterized protein LOC113464115 [Ceratina calcarata]
MNRQFARNTENERTYLVAIVPQDFPKVLMKFAETEEFGDALSECVLRYTEEARKQKSLNYTRPSFLNFHQKNGGILLTCETEETVRWIKVAIKHVRMRNGRELKVEERQALDNRFLAEGRCTHSRYNGRNILETIMKYNRGLDTSRWIVTREKQTRTGLIITIELEGRSVGTLRKLRNKIPLDQSRVHRFNVISVTPSMRDINQERNEGLTLDVTDDDFGPLLGGEGGYSPESPTSEYSQCDRSTSTSFDTDGDEFILSAELDRFTNMDIDVEPEKHEPTARGTLQQKPMLRLKRQKKEPR